MKKTMDNIISPSLQNIVKSFNCISSEIIFVTDIINKKIVCNPYFENPIFGNLRMSDGDNVGLLYHGELNIKDFNIDQVFDAINRYFLKHTLIDRESILFTIDALINLNSEEIYSTLKFTPILETEPQKTSLLLCSIGISCKKHINVLYAIDLLNDKADMYDLKSKCWIKSDTIKMSQTELEVIALAAEGKTTTEIAESLNKATDTIKSIKKKIFDKLNVSNIAEAVACIMSYKKPE